MPTASEAAIGVLSPGLVMSQAAFAGFTAASFAFPAAIPLVATSLKAQTDTGEMGRVSVELMRAFDELDQARDQVDNHVDRVTPDSWSSDDAEEFSQAAQQYSARLGLSSMVCVMAGSFTIIVAYLLFIQIVVLAVFAAILAALALALLVAMNFLPYSLPVALKIEMWGNKVAGWANTFAKSYGSAIRIVQNVLAGLLVAISTMGGISQAFMGGGWGSIGDMLKGVVSGSDDALIGLLQLAERDWVADKAGRAGGIFQSLNDGSPVISDWLTNPDDHVDWEVGAEESA